MQITDILAQAGGIQSMARELDVSESPATLGAEALVPAILGGQRSGAGGIIAGLLDQDGNNCPLDEILRQVGRVSH